MENRWQIALSAGLLATLWAGFSVQFNLVTWVGFLACSTYFAQHKVGFQGVISTCCSNFSGVFWAWIVIAGSGFFDQQLISYILTGVVTAAMCLQASYYKLSFIPGAFIGCCTTFAMQGDIANILPALLVGALLGYAMTLLTTQLVSLSNLFKKNSAITTNSSIE